MNLQSTYDAESESLQELLKHLDKTKYDLILWDLTTSHFLLPIIQKLNYPPVIATAAFALPIFFTNLFGHDPNLAYSPLWMMTYTDTMTFCERASNLIWGIYYQIVQDYWYLPKERELSEKVFGKDIPSLFELQKHVSVMLINSDHVMDYPITLPPALIFVGGLHTNRVEELPKVKNIFLVYLCF